MILLSIIIPVYNSEKYLKQCLDSILKFYNDEVEVILIDDGSTDGSLEICKKYKEKLYNCTLIESDNKGVSEARNQGIAVSKGLYLTFCDSDDWYEDLFPTVVQYLKGDFPQEVDLIIFGNAKEKYYNDQHIETVLKSSTKYLLLDQKLLGDKFDYIDKTFNLASPWNKIYRSKLIKNNKIEFIPWMKEYEDVEFNFRYFQYCKKILCIPDILYHWRIQLERSDSKRLDIKCVAYANKASEACLEFETNILNDKEKDVISRRILDMYSCCLHKLALLKRRRIPISDELQKLSNDNIFLSRVAIKKNGRKWYLLSCLIKIRFWSVLSLYINKYF